MRKKVLFIFIFLFLAVFGRIIVKAFQFSPVLFQVVFNKKIELKKTDETVNILLLGTGGGDHEGPNLTDTIIFASIDSVRNRVNLISLPRDMWVPDLEGKINTAYAKGEASRQGGGLVLAKAIVSKIIKQNVTYGFRIDFDGFVKAVDLTGGLQITVDREFDDYQYPVEEKREDLCGHTIEEATTLIASDSPQVVFPCRYEHVHLDRGLQHMDGKRALVYVRSRYAIGPEGTDFARSMRQQKVIQAFKDNILSPGTLLNPVRIMSLYSVLSKSIDTDIETSEFDDFIKLADKMRKATIHSEVIESEDIDQNKPGFLTNPPLNDFGGAWVLIPRIGSGDFSEIQEYVRCVLISNTCPISKTYGKNKTDSQNR